MKKASEKWWMCINYMDLNKACPMDMYPLTYIDKLVENSSGYKLLSFTNAYSGYNQIAMDINNRKNATFITEGANYMYNAM
jgi:hypothetical protein